jgi:hypothetical protein
MAGKIRFLMAANTPAPFGIPIGVFFVPTGENMPTAQGSCEPLISAVTAAQILCLHPKTLMRMARENRIPAFHYGRYWMFRPSLIDSWFDNQLQSTVANPSA